MIYKWKDSNYKIDAQLVGEELERIEKEYGVIDPYVLVEIAKHEDSILHNGFFDWNKENAAQNWNLFQARQLLRHITVIIIDKNEIEHNEIAYVNVKTIEVNGYQSTSVAMKIETSKDYVLSQAKKEMIFFRNKWRHLNELAKIISEIDSFLEQEL